MTLHAWQSTTQPFAEEFAEALECKVMEEKFSSASGMLSQRPMARCFVVELRRASWLARVPLDADEPTPPRVVRYPTSLLCIKLPACQQFLQLAPCHPMRHRALNRSQGFDGTPRRARWPHLRSLNAQCSWNAHTAHTLCIVEVGISSSPTCGCAPESGCG